MRALRRLGASCLVVLLMLPAGLVSEAAAQVPIVFSVSSASQPEADLYAVYPDGSGLRRLTDAPGLDMHPAWSPDGLRLVFASERDGGGRQLYVMQASGADPQPLTQDPELDHVAPSWSGNGALIAFHAQRVDETDVSRIYVMPATGGPPVALTDTASANAYARWSPDGRHLLFMSDRSGNWDLYTMTPLGTDVVRLTTDPADDMDLGDPWSPDGTSIAFISRRAGQADVWVATADGAGARNVTASSDLDFIFPSWSPDGQHLVVAEGEGIYGEGGAADPWSRLCIIDVATGAMSEMAFAAGTAAVPGLVLEPAWGRWPDVPTLLPLATWGAVKALTR